MVQTDTDRSADRPLTLDMLWPLPQDLCLRQTISESLQPRQPAGTKASCGDSGAVLHGRQLVNHGCPASSLLSQCRGSRGCEHLYRCLPGRGFGAGQLWCRALFCPASPFIFIRACNLFHSMQCISGASLPVLILPSTADLMTDAAGSASCP